MPLPKTASFATVHLAALTDSTTVFTHGFLQKPKFSGSRQGGALVQVVQDESDITMSDAKIRAIREQVGNF
jgi:hypothetical protein